MIQVKVARVPGRVTEVALEEGSTVQTALSTAGITDYANASVTIDDEAVALNRELQDGDSVLVSNKSVKGA